MQFTIIIIIIIIIIILVWSRYFTLVNKIHVLDKLFKRDFIDQPYLVSFLTNNLSQGLA